MATTGSGTNWQENGHRCRPRASPFAVQAQGSEARKGMRGIPSYACLLVPWLQLRSMRSGWTDCEQARASLIKAPPAAREWVGNDPSHPAVMQCIVKIKMARRSLEAVSREHEAPATGGGLIKPRQPFLSPCQSSDDKGPNVIAPTATTACPYPGPLPQQD